VVFSLALFIWVGIVAFLGLLIVLGLVLLVGGPDAAGYLAAREDQPGWTLVYGLGATLLAVWFGAMAVHDARIGLDGGPFDGVTWRGGNVHYPLFTTPSGALACAALFGGMALVSAWRAVQTFVEVAGKLRHRSTTPR
jgi:hypothetical protein